MQKSLQLSIDNLTDNDYRYHISDIRNTVRMSIEL